MVSALQGRAFRVHWEPFVLLCGIREVFSVEETLSQDGIDELCQIDKCVDLGESIPDEWDSLEVSVSIL